MFARELAQPNAVRRHRVGQVLFPRPSEEDLQGARVGVAGHGARVGRVQPGFDVGRRDVTDEGVRADVLREAPDRLSVLAQCAGRLVALPV